MKVKIKKSKYGFQYCLFNDTAYHFFPDNITTIEQMKSYFINGDHSDTKGIHNEPELVFVDQENREVKHYSINRNQRYVGNMFAIVDHDGKFLFEQVADINDQLQFLKDKSSQEVNAEADNILDAKERIKYYLKNITPEVKTEFQNYLDAQMTDEVLKEQCIQNAKTYGDNMTAVIEFED
jgi:hypothetical protein